MEMVNGKIEIMIDLFFKTIITDVGKVRLTSANTFGHIRLLDPTNRYKNRAKIKSI